MNELIVENRKPYSQVLVMIECENSTNNELKISYLFEDERQKAFYDFRVQDVPKPLKLFAMPIYISRQVKIRLQLILHYPLATN